MENASVNSEISAIQMFHFLQKTMSALRKIKSINKANVFAEQGMNNKMGSANIVVIMDIGMVQSVKSVNLILTHGLNYLSVDYASRIVKSVRMLFSAKNAT